MAYGPCFSRMPRKSTWLLLRKKWAEEYDRHPRGSITSAERACGPLCGPLFKGKKIYTSNRGWNLVHVLNGNGIGPWKRFLPRARKGAP